MMRGFHGRSRGLDFSSLAIILMTVCAWNFKCLYVLAEDSAEQATTPQDSTVEADPNNLYVTPQVNSDACYLAEHFDAGSISVFKSRWVKSETKKDGDIDEEIAKYDGEWGIEGAVENALNGDLGLVLKSKAKHHAVSAFLDRPFRFSSKSPLIIQYDVRFQEGMECGGAYIKLLSETDSLDLKEFHDKTPYTIMFGPDKCGNDLKLHFIFRYESPKTKKVEEKHMSIEGTDSFKHIFSDKYSHLLTLQIEADSRFELSVDQKVIKSGSLLNDFKPSVIPPTEVDDPSDKKPEDWDDRAKIPDPEAKKPDDWDESEPEKIVDPEASKPVEWLDDEPSYIPDPHAEKPDDWDVDLDGEWEAPLIENPKCKPGCGEWKAPLITNPKFKGKWYAPQIDNPNFKGIWKPRKIPNPEHFDDPNPFQNLAAISAIGLELWSMSNNIMFDNFVITSDSEVASQFASETWLKKKSKERMGFSNSDSVIDYLYKSANLNPWLWIVYALALILPITCCASYILSKPKPRKRRNQQPKTTSSSGQTEKEEHEQNSGSASAQAAGASSRDQLEACEEEQDEGQQNGETERDDSANPTNGEKANKGDLETAEDLELDEGEEAEDEEDNEEDDEEEEDDDANVENADIEDDDDEDDNDGKEEEENGESIESGGQEATSSQPEDAKEEVDETEPLPSEQGAATTIEEPSQPRKRRSRKD